MFDLGTGVMFDPDPCMTFESKHSALPDCFSDGTTGG
jgi:hypothetical protein